MTNISGEVVKTPLTPEMLHRQVIPLHLVRAIPWKSKSLERNLARIRRSVLDGKIYYNLLPGARRMGPDA